MSSHGITVRVDAPSGRHRFLLPHGACLADLMTQVELRLTVPIALQVYSLDREGRNTLPADGCASLQQCNVVNGTQVFLRIREQSRSPRVHVEQNPQQTPLLPQPHLVIAEENGTVDDDDYTRRNAAVNTNPASHDENDTQGNGSLDTNLESRHEIDTQGNAAADTNDTNVVSHEEKSVLQRAQDLLELWQKGKEWNIVVLSAVTGNELCTLKGSPEQTLCDLAMHVRLARVSAKPLEHSAVVFVQKGKVLHDRLTLQSVFSHDSESRILHALEQPIALVANALLRARCNHVLDSLDEYKLSIGQWVPNEPFGQDFARRVYAALCAGYKSEGRVTFVRQGATRREIEESWKLSCGELKLDKPDGNSVVEQLTVFRRDVFIEKDTAASGHIGLSVGGKHSVWCDEEEFVNFWESMTERKLQAYYAGLWLTERGLQVEVGNQCWVRGGPKQSELSELVRQFERKRNRRAYEQV